MPLPERAELERSVVPPAEGKWSKPPMSGAAMPASVALVGGTMFGLAVVASLAGSPLVAAAALIVLVATTASWTRRVQPSPEMEAADRMLLEDPGDADVCLVRLTVVRDGRVVGQDKGVVWFADDRLLYNGHRTSFALGGEDVLPRGLWPKARTRVDPEMSDRVLPLRVDEGTASIELDPVSGKGPSPAEMRFLKRFYDFRFHPVPSGGSRQWPPFQA